MQLYFIRHGQSENNRLWEQTGSAAGRSEDPELTALGRQQAGYLAHFLSRKGNPPGRSDQQNVAGFELTHLYCSLMLRAVQTGAIVAEALGLPLVAWPDWHEYGGIYLDDEVTGEPVGLPGKGRSYFERHFPALQLPPTVDETGWWNRPFETEAERPARAERVWRDLLARHGDTGDRVAVISHGGFFNYLLAHILGRPYGGDGCWFLMNNAALTRLDMTDGEVRIVYTNRADFLPPELIT